MTAIHQALAQPKVSDLHSIDATVLAEHLQAAAAAD